jgi:hypothetical protein
MTHRSPAAKSMALAEALFAVALVTVALVAAGCGVRTDDPAPVATPSTSPASASPTTAAAVPSLTAADGTRLKTCSDGECEVVVENGDSLPNAGGLGPVKVTVRDGEVTLSATSADGFSSTLSGNQGTVQQLNDQVFLIVSVQGRRAVLRMSTK